MASERWGALSVKDHNDAKSLVAELLLYDRLIFPFPGMIMNDGSVKAVNLICLRNALSNSGHYWPFNDRGIRNEELALKPK